MLTFMLFRLFSPTDEPEDTEEHKTFRRKEFDEEAFRKNLEGKTEKQLWKLRNEYHAKLIKSVNTEYYPYYLDHIGIIDQRIDYLRHL